MLLHALNYFPGASGSNNIYSISSPKGKQSNDGYYYDQSLETNLALSVSIFVV